MNDITELFVKLGEDLLVHEVRPYCEPKDDHEADLLELFQWSYDNAPKDSWKSEVGSIAIIFLLDHPGYVENI